jgi:hypothetical protein
MGRPYRPRVRTHAELDVPKGDRLSVCLSVYEDDGMRGRVDNACVLQRELRTKKEKKKKTSRPAQLPKTIDVNVGTQRAARCFRVDRISVLAVYRDSRGPQPSSCQRV